MILRTFVVSFVVLYCLILKFTKLKIIIFTGLVAIVGVVYMQLSMLSKAYSFERKELSEKIHFALQDVVHRIYRDNKSDLPITNQIKRVTDDYYIVNVNDVFEAEILEYYLKNEFEKVRLETDFEYAIYDCASDKMVYGDYISLNDKKPKCENCFTKKEELTYYFAVRFPKIKYSYISSLQNYWIYTGILILVLIIYVYSVLLLLKQKKYTELQNDFINNMTHEFKTPLSSILIASNYANSREEIKNNPKLAKYIQIIINQSNKLNQHIERILTVAKSDAKWIQLERKPVAIVAVLELVKENAILKATKEVAISTHPSEDFKVNADEFHLFNILFNLVDNAIKYGENYPEIKVNLIRIETGLEIKISDNGMGISQVHIPFVFDKFYRIPRENKKEIEGFGIGLFYVKKIIDLHHWKISLENNLEKGITVTIFIPKKDLL
jgi:two-component system phosphate regulon sensor histidine kinase PhoR